MSQFNYIVSLGPNGEVVAINRDDAARAGVPWSDADFQAWNAAQPVPFTLSDAQQKIQQAKALSFPQFQALTQAQKDRIVYELMQRALKGEVV